jgi:hypothetical protein
LEYLEILFARCRVEYTSPELAFLAGPRARWLESTEAYRLEGLPLRAESALLDDMVCISGAAADLGGSRAAWLDRVSDEVGLVWRRWSVWP